MKFDISRRVLVKFILSAIVLIIILAGVFITKSYIYDKVKHHPEMSIIIKYKEVPPVIHRLAENKISAYYRGCLIGRVSKVELSEDFRSVLFYLDIYYKKLRLPVNSSIYLNSGDIYGTRYFEIKCPETPCKRFLKNGDVINGTGYRDRIDKYLMNEFEPGMLQKLITNAVFITDVLKTLASDKEKPEELFKAINAAKKDIGGLLKGLSEIANDPEIKRDLKLTAKYSASTLENINDFLETKEIKEVISDAPEMIIKTVKNIDEINENIPKVNKTVSKTNAHLCRTNCELGTINEKVPEIPEDLLVNAGKL